MFLFDLCFTQKASLTKKRGKIRLNSRASATGSYKYIYRLSLGYVWQPAAIKKLVRDA